MEGVIIHIQEQIRGLEQQEREGVQLEKAEQGDLGGHVDQQVSILTIIQQQGLHLE